MERAEMVRRGAEAAWRVDWPGAEWEFASLSAEDREWYGQLAEAVLVDAGVLPLGGDTRTAPDPDDMDGGVTAALIEQEAQGTVGALIAELERHRARAEKAEQERDEALASERRASERWRKELTLRNEVADELRRLRATQTRPLTPDAITDEMVERARAAYQDAPVSQSLNDDIRDMLTAALTEPPKRPEGAEEIQRLLTEDLGDFRPPVTPEAIADLLASRGVRVVAEEDPR